MSDFTNVQAAPFAGGFGALTAPFRYVAHFFDTLRLAVRQQQAYEELSRLSDAELERRGLARDGLVQYIYSEIR